MKLMDIVTKTSEYVVNNLDAVKQALQEFRLDKNYRLKTTASSMAFYSLWSLIPMIYLIIELVFMFNKDVLDYLREIIMNFGGLKALEIFNAFVSSRLINKPSILIFFIASLIISTTKLTRMIVMNTELVFDKRNSIFGLKVSFIVRWILAYIISTVFPLVISLVLIFSNVINTFIHQFDTLNPYNGVLIALINYSIVPVCIFLLILIVFILTNPASKKFRENYQASLFVSIGWFITSKVMSLFIVKNLKLAIYGSFSVMILLFIWVYIFCYIFSIGIIINKYVHEIKYGDYAKKLKEVRNEI